MCIVVFVILLMLMQMVRLHYPVPGKHPPGLGVSFVLMNFLGLFIGYVVPWMNRRCRSMVTMRITSLSKTRGQHTTVITYKSLRGYSWTREENTLVLVLHREKGSDLAIGVPDEATLQAADQLLRESAVVRFPDAARS